MDIQVAAAVLSNRYEQQLLYQQSRHGKAVPVLVVTGFLGSGKTTTVSHLLAATCHELKLGVLVNEVASLDVDGQLLSTSQSNAAAGIRSAQLAGGCACCSVSSDLQAALQELAGSSSYQQLDYLLLETSGVADAEPLAALCESSGFKLAGVVAVVDAEAGATQLQEEAVALAQLRQADVVVVNKCDLASLSALASLEDLIQDKAPGVRMLRARFGQVPPEALLDLDVEEEGGHAAGTAAAGAGQAPQQQQQQSVQGEIAFLSHEPVVSTQRARGRSKPGTSLLSTQRAARSQALAASSAGATAQQPQGQQQVHHSHSSFVSVSYSSTEPLCMACFQAFVSNSLLTATGLFRAKGFVWFQQQRSRRYVFHVSGKQRAECGAIGRWQGPPGVQLVLIGQDSQVLLQLKQELQACTASCCCCSRKQQQQQHLQQQEACVAGSSAEPCLCPAAARFAELVQQHHRFELTQQHVQQAQLNAGQQLNEQQQQQQAGDGPRTAQLVADSSGSSALVQFTAVGSALHGVVAEEVNAAVLRKASATPGLLFMCHIKSPAALRTAAASSQQVAYQGVLALQLCFRSSDSAQFAEQQWQCFEAAVAAVLRKAYQHAHNCKCDVVQLVTA